MNNYVLTERGRIIVTVILIVVLLLIPSVIIVAAVSCNNSSPPDDTSPPDVSQTHSNIETPEITNTPLSEPDSGVENSVIESPNTPETPQPADTVETPSPTPADTPEEPDPTPAYGPVDIDLDKGTMSFMFAPEIQESLDDDTVKLLGEFLTSPRNTSGSIVKVVMPPVSDEIAQSLISAVGQALALYNIKEDGIVYAENPRSTLGDTFEVALSYTVITNQK